MPRHLRALAAIAAVEAALLTYAAMAAFLTPTGTHAHNVLLTVVLLGIAAPLAWHAATVAFAVQRPADPLMLRVIIPNGALVVLCFSGALEGGPRTHGLLPALVAGVGLIILVGAVRVTRSLATDTSSVRA